MNHRTKYLLATAVALAVVGLVFGKRITHELTSTLVLRQDSPSPQVVVEILDESPNQAQLVRRLWATGKLPHRHSTLEFLKIGTADKPELYESTREIILDGAVDADFANRETALGILALNQDPELKSLARTQLSEPDRDLRILGLQYLRREENQEQLIPELIELLRDDDPLVVAQAASTLRRWTGNDFGIRNELAVTKPQTDGSNATPNENLDKIAAGVDQWLQWWSTNRVENRENSIARSYKASTEPLPVEDFELEDLDGNLIRLSRFRGKTVLLNFWTTWCTACMMEMPDLIALNRSNSDRLVILGISLDGADDHGHDHAAIVDIEEARQSGVDAVESLEEWKKDGDQHGHHGHHHGPDLEKTLKKVRRVATKKKLEYRILLDMTGEIGARFNGHELPTNVLIDREGRLRRRFIGSRPLASWEAMLDEIAPR